jgi:UDP-N-acetylmuramoylalanine-D-glutamate ligase
MQSFKHKKVAILGLSVEGLDSVKFFRSEGADIWCCDRRTAGELGSTYTDLKDVVDGFQLGESYLHGLERFDIVVRTPGMSIRFPQFTELQNRVKKLRVQPNYFLSSVQPRLSE